MWLCTEWKLVFLRSKNLKKKKHSGVITLFLFFPYFFSILIFIFYILCVTSTSVLVLDTLKMSFFFYFFLYFYIYIFFSSLRWLALRSGYAMRIINENPTSLVSIFWVTPALHHYNIIFLPRFLHSRLFYFKDKHTWRY